MAVLFFFFLYSISTCQGPAAVHVGPSTSPTATAAMVLSAKAQKAWDHQSSGGNREAMQRWSGNQLDHASTMALPKNSSMNLPLRIWTHHIPVLLLSPPSAPLSLLFCATRN